MKHAKNIFAILLIILLSKTSRGQDEYLKDLYLKGKWTASCPVEILDHASMQQCRLCPFVIDTKNKSRGQVKDIEINFMADSIQFNQSGKITVIPYIRNKETHALSFMLDHKQYNFRMFLDDDRRILLDSDGMILVLEKVK